MQIFKRNAMSVLNFPKYSIHFALTTSNILYYMLYGNKRGTSVASGLS